MPRQTEMIGTKLAHYEITSHLGSGGMGDVYQATDTKLGRSVAIKFLPDAFSHDIERVGRFEREARVLASLNHSNIAVIFGLEESGERKFIVMELVDGETLAERIKRGPVPVDEALSISKQICEALESAHSKGIIHRDLKPANVKITKQGQVKLLDFGLAKAFAGGSAEVNLSNSPTLGMAATNAGVILGTAAYMSPEQAKGKATDRTTDMWAFGCILYEMLTGRPTWTGETVAEVIASILSRDPNWTLLPPHPRLLELVRRCLDKDPKQRWQDAGDVRVELQRIVDDPGTRERTALPNRSNLRLVLPWAAAAIAAVAAWTFKPAPPSEPHMVTRFYHELPQGQIFSSTRNVVAVSADGRQLVYQVAEGFYLRSMNSLDARLILPTATGAEQGASLPFLSPDGQWLGYYVQNQLRKISTTGGAAVTLCAATGPSGASWQPDGTILFALEDGIWRVSANGGMPELIARTAAGEQADGPQLLPGGKHILFSIARGTGPNRWDTADIVVQTPGSNERKVVWRGGSDVRYVPTGHLVYAVGNVLFALPFDADRLEVTGGPRSVVEGLRRVRNSLGTSATANYGISGDGTLVYVQDPLAAVTKGVPAFVDRSGGIERIPLPPNEYRGARLSPDGRRIAVEIVGADGGSAVWVYNVSGDTQIRRLTQEGNNIVPIWTPDSQRITFASDRDGGWAIYWQPADGSGMAERLTMAEKGAQQFPDSWSPDGRVLSFVYQGVAGSANSQALWTLSMDRRKAEVFYDVPNQTQGGMTFSPNGKWVAYASIEGPGSDFGVFVEPFPRVPGVRYEITTGSNYPLWSPDGKELFYRARATNALAGLPSAISRVEVRTDGSSFAFTNEKRLSVPGLLVFQNYSNYDITPDGRRFLVLVKADQTPAARPVVHIVENWFEELKQRLAVK